METVEKLLVDSDLLDDAAIASQLQQWRGDTAEAEQSAARFVERLVEQEWITDFQGDAILEGHTGPFMLGPYEVHEHVASGWLGGIFRAVHTEFQQPVSLKIFAAKVTDDPEKLSRVGRELRVACELDHPNLIRTFDVGEVGDLSYLAMDDLRGETLAERLEHEGRLPLEDACRVIRDVAKGLANLHEQGFVLRDIRPENIWITTDDVPKIMEFGGVKDPLGFLDLEGDETELSSDETVIGEYDYMSPEQARDVRLADARSDIYSLGCVLYECLTGQPPFVSKNPTKLVMMHVSDTPPSVSTLVNGLPTAIDETIGGMLAKQPEDRFKTADDVAYALDQYAPQAAAETVSVVDVNPQYIEWARSRHPTEGRRMSKHAVGITPELTEFLTWISRKKSRKRVGHV